jgi:DNA-binding NarL/FixJ family response regulator
VTTDPEVISVALAESQALVREALKLLLNTAAGITVVAEAPSAPEIVSVVRSCQPDIVLLAIDPVGDHLFAVIQELSSIAERGRGRALIVTGQDDPSLLLQAIERGAMGIVTKDQTGDVLIKAVRKVYAGEMWLGRERTAAVVRRLARGHDDDDPESLKVKSLTAREREIVVLIADGLHNREIGDRLSISEATVRNHMTSILSKLELTSRFELAVYAYRHGLVLCPQTTAMLRMSAAMKVSCDGRRNGHSDPLRRNRGA